jgi:hypothetical protein
MKFEKAVSASALARILGVTPQTIINAIAKGSIPATQLVPHGKHLIHPREAELIVRGFKRHKDEIVK